MHKAIWGGWKMSDDLTVTTNRGDGYTVVYTDGYINDTEGDKIAEMCYGLMEEGVRHFILDLEKSTVISSIGMAVLMEIVERVQEIEGSVSFCHLTRTIAKTFRIVRLTDVVEIYGDEEEAIGALAG
jgi:anti-anti-sigma factor